jgi:hypothetical protein
VLLLLLPADGSLALPALLLFACVGVEGATVSAAACAALLPGVPIGFVTAAAAAAGSGGAPGAG